MRECALCHTKVEDHVTVCPECSADLTVDSVRAQALKAIKASPRVSKVFIVAPDGACPVCRQAQGTYLKETVAEGSLPHEGCSCAGGCNCRYEPFVDEVGP